MPQDLHVIAVSTKATASADGQRIVLRTFLTFDDEIGACADGATPAETIERFRHALEESAQAKLGGSWLAIPLLDDPASKLPPSLSATFALLALDALSAALQTPNAAP